MYHRLLICVLSIINIYFAICNEIAPVTTFYIKKESISLSSKLKVTMRTRIFTFLMLFSAFAFGQQSGTIKGSVIDKSSGAGIESADVTLHKVKDSTLVKGTSTDASGNFTLAEIPPGRYYIKASLVGYSSSTVSGITITPANQTLTIDPIKLSS